MIIKNFKQHSKGSLLAYFDLVIPKWGDFVIKGCSLFKKGSHKWLALPSRKVDEGGESKYYPINCFEDKEVFKKFELAVIAKIEEDFGAL